MNEDNMAINTRTGITQKFRESGIFAIYFSPHEKSKRCKHRSMQCSPAENIYFSTSMS